IALYWAAGIGAAIVVALTVWVWRKGQPFASGDVFRASRLSAGNRLFPTQVQITPTSVVQYTPRWIGKQEETIHMAHIAPVKLDVENCVKELVDFGVAQAVPGNPPRYMAERPGNEALADQLEIFLERRAAISNEDQSASVQRFREMIGRDEKMLIVFEWIRTAAKSDISVLILGPTGSGKEVVARMIHELSPRSVANFQAVNCAALPDTLFESEIFGYEKGAFTGAHDRKPG